MTVCSIEVKPGDENNEKLEPLLENSIEKIISKKASFWPQLLIALLADICPFLAGFSAGFVGVYLPNIREDLDLTEEEETWIASVIALGSIPGGFLAAWISEQFGRSRALQSSLPLFFIGWLLIAFGGNFFTILAGRFINGVAMGLQSGSKQAYFSELFDPDYRGVLTSTTITAANLGILVSFLIALLLSWRTSAMLVMGISGVFIFVSFVLPETPVWLMMNDRNEKAIEVMTKMRGTEFNTQKEMEELEKKKKKIRNENEEARGHCGQRLKLFFSHETIVAFGILFLIFFIQRFSGAPVVNNYIKDIFNELYGEGDITSILVVITGVIRLLSTTVSNILVKVLPKKVLLAISGFGMAISLLPVAIFTYPPAKALLNGHTWVLPTSLCIYIACMGLGFSSVSWSLIGELFPQRTRGIMSSLFPTVGFFLYFVAAKTYKDFEYLIGFYGTFGMYGCCAFVGTIIVYKILPETDGKSLTEIENGIGKVNNNDSKSEVPQTV